MFSQRIGTPFTAMSIKGVRSMYYRVHAAAVEIGLLGIFIDYNGHVAALKQDRSSMICTDLTALERFSAFKRSKKRKNNSKT